MSDLFQFLSLLFIVLTQFIWMLVVALIMIVVGVLLYFHEELIEMCDRISDWIDD